jgi:hypothetical protein
MIKPEQIPADVWNAYLRAWEEGKAPAVCLVTALNAWEGAGTHRQPEWEKLSGIPGADVLCLPLPKEPRT